MNDFDIFQDSSLLRISDGRDGRVHATQLPFDTIMSLSCGDLA